MEGTSGVQTDNVTSTNENDTANEPSSFQAVPNGKKKKSLATMSAKSAAFQGYGGEEEKTEPIWFKEDEKWELTWPIWHMLPRDERKALADRYGYKTIGDFEEYMTLRRAVGVSEGDSKPYDNQLLYDITRAKDQKEDSTPMAKRKTDTPSNDAKLPAKEEEVEEGEEEETMLIVENADEKPIGVGRVAEDLSEAELLERGGLILSLPEELLHSVSEWLPIDSFAALALASPHWHYISRTEAVYKRLCERSYLNQSKRRTLNVARFGGSYRIMLTNRPRVRVGLYVLKFAKVKPIQRDMWTEIPVGAILETVYYRYLYFQENGKVLYALTTSSPHEMIPRLQKMNITGEPDKAAVWGHFQVQGKSVVVIAKQDWHTVKLELSIQPSSIWGRFGALSFDRHFSSSSGDFDEYFSHDLVEYKVPPEVFRYLRDRRL